MLKYCRRSLPKIALSWTASANVSSNDIFPKLYEKINPVYKKQYESVMLWIFLKNCRTHPHAPSRKSQRHVSINLFQCQGFLFCRKWKRKGSRSNQCYKRITNQVTPLPKKKKAIIFEFHSRILLTTTLPKEPNTPVIQNTYVGGGHPIPKPIAWTPRHWASLARIRRPCGGLCDFQMVSSNGLEQRLLLRLWADICWWKRVTARTTKSRFLW